MPSQMNLNSASARVSIVPDIADACFDWRAENEASSLPSDIWRKWLFDSSSLTQLLIRKSNNRFHVEVKAQEWMTLPNAAVRAQFGPLTATHRFWSRKVVLYGNDTPWVLAHTLIP